jgi:Pvc16 N-terminal domain
MANVLAIHSVGTSLVTYLRNTYPSELRTAHPCEFKLFASAEMGSTEERGTTLSLYLYRITMNEHVRNVRGTNDLVRVDAPMSVDLHFLLTVWADNALAEQTILAWAMRQLHQRPVLDRSTLSPEGGWDPSDIVHVIPAELSHEDLMRIWDALEPSYRLSLSYSARVVRIDPEAVPGGLPVVARNFTLTGPEVSR